MSQQLPLITIVGPTATGKSELALRVADWLVQQLTLTGVDIISADSRQVYQGLEIISGADIPAGFTLDESNHSYCQGAIRIFGIGMLSPTAEWSVSQFQTWAHTLIEESISTERAVIIVGGTGLYQQQLWQEDTSLHVPPSEEIRQQAAQLSLIELQAWLHQVAPETLASLNHSDRQNPRRLVRKIEIAVASSDIKKQAFALPQLESEQITIGLTDDLSAIESRIQARVSARFSAGAAQELARLLDRYPHQKLPLFSSTGVKPLLAYLADEIDAETCQNLWVTQERQYAKRQLTWWKKRSAVKWFSVSLPQWQEEVLHYLHYVGISHP